MLNTIYTDAETRMKKCIENLQSTLMKVRTGRAHPSLLDSIKVPYYGTDTPLNQVANVSITDSRTISVSPFEKNLVSAVEKAILSSDLGLNPVTVGTLIRVPLPPLSEERRKELIKHVKSEGESSKLAVRNVRRDANTQLKDALKDKDISEDEERQGQDKIQKLTDKYVEEIDKILGHKEAELLEV